jgi:hypothetical protein
MREDQGNSGNGLISADLEMALVHGRPLLNTRNHKVLSVKMVTRKLAPKQASYFPKPAWSQWP